MLGLEMKELVDILQTGGLFISIYLSLMALKRPKFNVKAIVKEINSMQLGTGSKE